MTAHASPIGPGPTGPGPTAPPPAPPAVSPLRLVATLGISGALAGLLLVSVHRVTEPVIAAHKQRVLEDAVLEVLAGPTSYRTLYLVDGAFTPDLPAGADPRTLDTVYAGLGDDGARLDGFAIPASKPGFQDKVSLLFGWEPKDGTVRAIRVLESRETPGLGDRIEKDPAFAAGFVGRTTPLVGVKAGRGTGAPSEVDMITGATISSRTVIDAIDTTLARLRPALDAYAAEAAR